MMKNEDCENDALFDRNSTREALELSIFCTEKQLCIIEAVFYIPILSLCLSEFGKRSPLPGDFRSFTYYILIKEGKV